MSRYKFKNRKFPKSFNTVVDYIKSKKGISVSLGSRTEFTGYFNRQILIHHNYDLTGNGLFVLLYEVGRVMNPKFNTHTKANNFINNITYWDTGYSIAKELNLELDNGAWEREKIKHLNSLI